MRHSIATVSLSGMLREKLQAAAAAGFGGVEIIENDLLRFPGSPREVRQICADLGLSIDLFQPFRNFDADFAMDDAALYGGVLGGSARFDQLVQAVPAGQVESWLLFHRAVLGLAPEHNVAIHDPYGIIRSREIESGDRAVRTAITVSEHDNTSVSRAVSSFRGAGNYHDDLAARYDIDAALLAALRERGILYDREPNGGELLQLYRTPFDDRFHFELIERRGGYAGYGAMNATFRLAARRSGAKRTATPRIGPERCKHLSIPVRRRLNMMPGRAHTQRKTMINGNTELIAHIGYPTHAFKAPMIYNPYFDHIGVNVRVMPMGCQSADYPAFLRAVFTLTNIRGALITMPHKVTTLGLLDRVTPTVEVAGSCNAVRRGADGLLEGDMFDGEGFVRGVLRKGLRLDGARALVVGTGGVGSAIAASLAASGIGAISLYDMHTASCEGLAGRLKQHYPALDVRTGSNDPAGHDLVVNATPMGMNEGDALPMDISRLAPTTFVGEVVMRTEMTAFLTAAQARGCPVQVGSDMLFEQIPAYLEFFGFPTTTAEVLRSLAALNY
jgi:shikimate dehydrogenase